MVANLRKNNSISRMPSHPQQQLDWQGNPNYFLANHNGVNWGFTYIAPTIKYSEAIMTSTSPVYKGGEAYGVGNQPYDSRELWMAARTPATPRLVGSGASTSQMGRRRIQGSADVLNSQTLISALLKKQAGG